MSRLGTNCPSRLTPSARCSEPARLRTRLGMLATLVAALVTVLGTTWLGMPTAGATSPGTGAASPALISTNLDELGGVSCVSQTLCFAVGDSQSTPTANGVTLAERWNGSGWKVQSTPNPIGAQGGGLDNVSCSSATSCIAVGSFFTSGEVETALALRWDGTAWKLQPVRIPTGTQDSFLEGISCTSPTACTAVGMYDNSTGNAQALIERWNGTSWKLQSSPNPTTAQDTVLHAVSCTTPTACTAVGAYSNSSFPHIEFAEAWNGSSWSLQDVPFFSKEALFHGVSCTSPSACTAVGYYFANAGQLALTDRWDGSNWNYQHNPSVTGAQLTSLGAVSCASSTACTGVGSYVDSTNHAKTLAEAWNGNSWSIAPTPNATGQTASALRGVSCSSTTACTAVGQSTNTNGGFTFHSLVERWNGTAWKVQVAP